MESIGFYCMKKLARLTGAKKLAKLEEKDLLNYIDRKLSRQKSTPSPFLYNHYCVEENEIDGHAYYVVTPKENPSEKSVIMIHGGAYVIEIGIVNWRAVAKLIDSLHVSVYVPIYPLTPDFTYYNTFDMMKKLYLKVLETTQAKHITVIGDSAGAQIGLSFCQYLKILNLPQPGNIILLSPPLDNDPPESEKEEMKRLEPYDCLVSSNLFDTAFKWWSEGIERNHYLVSPIYGDFENLGKISMFYSTHEVIFAQIKRFKEQGRTLGIDVDYYEGKGMLHCWPYLPFKEGNVAFDQIVQVIRKEHTKKE